MKFGYETQQEFIDEHFLDILKEYLKGGNAQGQNAYSTIKSIHQALIEIWQDTKKN